MAETKILITADTAKAESAIRTLGQTIDGATRKVFDMSGAATTLAGALSVGAFVSFIKSGIDAQDEIDKLSIKTGTAVETLAGLKFAADQNDTSLQSVAEAAKKLSTNLVDKPELFAKFGITAKDTTGALIQMADIFATMPDGAEKTALAVKLMGKNGEEMIPLLNNGSAALAAQIEQGKQYNKMTAESAAQAAEFNDNLSALTMSANGLGVELSGKMLKPLTDITRAMMEAAKEGGLLKAALVGIGGVMTGIFTDDMLSREQKITKDLEELRSKQMHALQGKGNWILNPVGAWQGRDSALNERNNQMLALEKELQDLQSRLYEKNKPIESAQDGKKGRSLLSALTGNASAANNSAFIESMQREADIYGMTAGQIKIYEAGKKGIVGTQMQQVIAIARVIDAHVAEKKSLEELKKQQEDMAKGGAIISGLSTDYQTDINKKNRTLNDALTSAADRQHADNLDAVAQRAARAREEISKLSIGDEERLSLLDAVNKAESDQIQQMEALRQQVEKNNASWEYGARVALRNYLDEARNVSKQSETLFTNAFKGMEDALVNFVRTGKLDFTSLADSIISNLIRIQVQEMMLNMLKGYSSGSLSNPNQTGAGGFTNNSSGETLSYAGGGYTGDGARSGGVDGMGGFWAVLHPNETVIDHTLGRSGSSSSPSLLGAAMPPTGAVPAAAAYNPPGVVINFINQTDKQLNAKQQGDAKFDGRDFIIGVVLEAADTNPNFRAAMGMGR